MTTQERTSANTSRKQVAATFKRVTWNSTDKVLDYGGGRYDLAAEYMKGKVADFRVFDPFWRTEKENAHAFSMIPNIVTCNNVLNVLDSDEAVEGVIRAIAGLVTHDGTVYFLIHEGNKSGIGCETDSHDGKCWQRNEKTAAYIPLIQRYFKEVARHGNLIVAR